MFQSLLVPLAISAILFIGYLFLRAYRPDWFRFGKSAPAVLPRLPYTAAETETFVAAPPTPPPTKVNTAAPPVPAAAPPIKETLPMEPREVAPGGPNTPNAAPPAEASVARMSPEASPLDPYDDRNMEAPIHDSMRHPELSFGPGVDNTATKIMAPAGIGSARTLTEETPFSPDFAQNGANFMGDVFANDLKRESFFAEA